MGGTGNYNTITHNAQTQHRCTTHKHNTIAQQSMPQYTQRANIIPLQYPQYHATLKYCRTTIAIPHPVTIVPHIPHVAAFTRGRERAGEKLPLVRFGKLTPPAFARTRLLSLGMKAGSAGGAGVVVIVGGVLPAPLSRDQIDHPVSRVPTLHAICIQSDRNEIMDTHAREREREREIER